jgi:RHS repeat-associated protein
MQRCLSIFLVVAMSSWLTPVVRATRYAPVAAQSCPSESNHSVEYNGQNARARYLNPNTGRFWTMDSYEGDNEDPLSLHKYLYGGDDPVNVTDPSGHDGDLGSLMMSTSIGAGLDSMYNGGVVFAGMAMQHTLIGVQNGETGSAILGDYFLDVGKGLAVGIAIGMVADIAGDIIFGKDIEGEAVGVEANGANTVEGSRNFAAAESTTEDLMGAAARAIKAVEPGPQPVYGTKVHTEFEQQVIAARPDLEDHTEISYYKGMVVYRGYPGSVRLDVVEGDLKNPTAIYDLKTGGAKLTAARIAKIRSHLPNKGEGVPIVMIKPPK